MQNQGEARIAELEAKLAAAESEGLDVRAKLRVSTTECAEVKSRLAGTEKECAALKAKLATTVTECTSLRANLAAMERKFADMGTKLASTEAELAAARVRLSGDDNMVAMLESPEDEDSSTQQVPHGGLGDDATSVAGGTRDAAEIIVSSHTDEEKSPRLQTPRAQIGVSGGHPSSSGTSPGVSSTIRSFPSCGSERGASALVTWVLLEVSFLCTWCNR